MIPLLAITLLNCAIGLYVWRQRPVSAANRSFAFLTITISLWTLSIAFAHHTDFLAPFSTNSAFLTASLMPLAILCVFKTFPNEARLNLDPVSRIFALFSVSFAILSLTRLVVASASRSPTGLRVVYGPLYTVYGVSILACFAWSFRVLIPRYLRSSGLARLQFRYFLLGLLVPGVGVTITNLLIPLLSSSSHYGQYGPYFALIFVAFTAHALIRYRLMDIRLVIQAGLSLLLAFAASLVLITGALLLLTSIFHWDLPVADIAFLLIGGSAFGVFLQPLWRLFKRLLDSYAYRLPTDYQKTLRDASSTLGRILDLDSLASFLVPTILKATHSEHVGLYLHSGQHFTLVHHKHYLDTNTYHPPDAIPSISPLVELLKQTREPLVAEELAARDTRAYQAVLTELKSANWELLVPLTSQEHLMGIIVTGPKLSQDPFFSEDVALLSGLAAHAMTAMTNARLYQQVVLVNEYVTNILRTMESGVIAISQDNRITLFNSAAERMTGLSTSRLLTHTVDNLPAVISEALQETARDGYPRLQLETTLFDARKQLIPVIYSTSPLRDERQQILGAVLVFSDLTTLKHLEAQKQQAERLASLATVASGIAHEIKNPLVAIRTFAELLSDRYTDVEFRDYFSRVVVTEIDRIDDLVSKLRGLASPTPPPSTTVDIREPLEDTLALLRAQFEQQRIIVQLTSATTDTLIVGDAAQLKQLFINIFLNSIQSMPSGGTLSILLTHPPPPPSRSIQIDVSDTGTGIPTSILSTMFEPFVTTKPLGSGLGLAICRKIAESHNALIRAVNNDNGVGATVSIEFSLASAGTWPPRSRPLTVLPSSPDPLMFERPSVPEHS